MADGTSQQVRFGVIGTGGMGSFHISYLQKMADAKLTAVCDTDATKVEKVAPAGVAKFTSTEAMLKSGEVDAVLIATPHPFHPDATIAALDHGVSVLCEKPVAISITQARAMNAAAEKAAAKNPKVKYGVMLNQRTIGLYRKLRELIADGELGDISRVSWIMTDWFRPWAYYASGGWRATWKGEGGGVLINQCPHNLDLLLWTTGLTPSRISAVGFVGKTHPIEVEDEISAILEYPNGAIGHFITTTGEAPGTNRLEIVGDRGRMVVENGKLLWTRTRRGVKETRETIKEAFHRMETWEIDLTPTAPKDPENLHRAITENFAKAILKDEAMIAPGVDGSKALELGNAMQMAALTRKPVDLPLDGAAFDAFHVEMNKQYGGKKKLATVEPTAADLSASFSKV
jgi:predicted dehydrogenase